MAAELLVDDVGPHHLRISGEIDTHTAPALAERLAAIEASSDLAIDLEGTTFISSAGLSALLAASERLTDAGGSLRIVAASETVVRLIELSGLADRLSLGDQLGDDD